MQTIGPEANKCRYLTFLMVAVCIGASGLDVPLLVEEPAGVSRSNAPVSSGICFPRGALKKAQEFSLWDGERELPLQVTPLVVDQGGFLRWALLDFQMDLKAGEQRRLLLRSQPPKARLRAALNIKETDDAIVISTGPLELTVGKSEAFGLFKQALCHGRVVANQGLLNYIDAQDGLEFVAGRPARIVWEYLGPLRATLRVEGDYECAGKRGLSYITRITLWAGRTDVRVQHILANSDRQQVHYANIQKASLVLAHAFGTAAEALTGLPSIAAGLSNQTVVWLHQGKENRYYREPVADAARAGVGANTKWTGADSGGWIMLRQHTVAQAGALTEKSLNLFVCDRDFAGDPPRRLQADSRQITLEYISSKFSTGRGVPFRSEHFWLYDLSHKTAEIWIDFGAQADGAELAQAARARLLAMAPGEWYSTCDVFGVGPFGTLADEQRVYQKWGWQFTQRQIPQSKPAPGAFVRWEDNHYESEADSAEALLLMAVRTGQRGYFDQGEAWARYHANMHAWRSDGWVYDDGAIWFPQGGPLGTKPARKPATFKYQHWDKGTGDDRELWHLVQAKSCYCHFYGAGLVDAFLLSGERDFLEAAIDLAEQKNSEFRKHRQFTPGKTTISDTRGFGRGFYVITHLLEAVPENEFVRNLAQLCRDVLWQCPNLDERGFAPCHIGTGFGGFDIKRDLPEGMKAFMDKEGIKIDERGWLTDRNGARWPVVCLGGTWQHFYVAAAAERYARMFNDEDMADMAEAYGRFAAKYMLSEKCKQTWYYAYMDVPIKGRPWDPWLFQPPHINTVDGDGCEHEGYYTRFFPDVIAKAYSLAGDGRLLERAREFWLYGSRRGYRTRTWSTPTNVVAMFATHFPPKDDTVLSTSRMFYEWANPRADALPPEAVRDLVVVRQSDGTARVSFTAPRDNGGGRVVRYQLKCAELPIVDYDDYDFARDDGKKRNFWRATNLSGEPAPGLPGTKESFVATGVPERPVLYFVISSYDSAGNRSRISNVFESKKP